MLKLKPAQETIPAFLNAGASLELALHLMRQTQGPALPVLEAGRFVGVVLRDELQLYAPSPASTLSRWELPLLLQRVSLKAENLIRTVPHLAPGSTFSDLVRAMQESQSPVVAIVQDGRLQELISWKDVLGQVQTRVTC